MVTASGLRHLLNQRQIIDNEKQLRRRMVSWDPPDQSSPNSGNKCPLARPLMLPNFVAMYEKSVTKIFLQPLVFWRSWAKIHQFQHRCTARPELITCRISYPSDNLPTRYLLYPMSWISLMAWPTKNSKHHVFAYHAATKNSSGFLKQRSIRQNSLYYLREQSWLGDRKDIRPAKRFSLRQPDQREVIVNKWSK